MESAALVLGARRVPVGGRALTVGVINVTPDSFWPASRADGPSEAAALAVRLESEGADLLDVGGCSTRPGSTPVPTEVELARVVPAVSAIRSAVGCPLSVDTFRAAVARAAVEAGADLINDVRGLAGDPEMAAAVADLGVPVIAMAGEALPDGADPLPAVAAQLREVLDRAAAAGLDPRRIILDPGFGFGKTPTQNLALICRLGELRALGRPLCVGPSRKGTVGALLGGVGPEARLEGTAALVALAVASGADLVRVHDVAAMAAVARVAQAATAAGSAWATGAWPSVAGPFAAHQAAASAGPGPAGVWPASRWDAGAEAGRLGRTDEPGADRIRIEGLRFEAIHGVYPEERVRPQPFLVDVELSLDLGAAGRSDDLTATVDYNRVARAVADVMEGPSRRLIESLAEAVAERVRSAFPVRQIRVRVHKPHAPVGLPFADISVEVVRPG